MRFAIVDKTSRRVLNVVEWDGSIETWAPPTNTDAIASEVAQIDDTYDEAEGVFIAPPAPPAPPVTSEQVLAERSARMAQATAEIAPLQDLVDLDEADEDDEAKLLEWRQYRAAVSKVQTQPGYPSAVVWPDVPTL